MGKITKKIRLSRLEKILLTLYDLSGGTKRSVKFEDIAVALFKRFPKEFHLRDYPEYPDTGEGIHRPLYRFREEGVVYAGNKIFGLTEKGILVARRLKKLAEGKKIKPETRLSRYAEEEISRIKSSDAFVNFFLTGKRDKIIDTDFYDYLGVTVRTRKSDFLGRLKTIEDTIKEISKVKNDILYEKLAEYHKFMLNKFQDIIDYKSKN